MFSLHIENENLGVQGHPGLWLLMEAFEASPQIDSHKMKAVPRRCFSRKKAIASAPFLVSVDKE